MKKLITLLSITACLFLIMSCDSENSTGPEYVNVADVLFINEFMADNDNILADNAGDYDDWIEIYNSSNQAIDIGGMFISDNSDDLGTWQIPTTCPDSTTIVGGGFLILFADKETEQGILHVDIKLSADGESIILTDSDTTTVIDSLSFGVQTTDVSMGRSPDGGNSWMAFTNSTPGTSNTE